MRVVLLRTATDLYSDGAGLCPNHSRHSIKPAAPELRRAAIFALELGLVELAEVRNGTWDRDLSTISSGRPPFSHHRLQGKLFLGLMKRHAKTTDRRVWIYSSSDP
jgi:hypothetical protein